jgi:hypothetical protein
MKIRQVGAQLFNANGQTDMTKLLATFRHFAKAPQKKDMTKLLATFRHFAKAPKKKDVTYVKSGKQTIRNVVLQLCLSQQVFSITKKKQKFFIF